ncbi:MULTISPECIES: hypothetical protein [Pseudorhizobium]|uniref:Uncharacterized protein n=1 Tax=Pseudorhizobium flavum TaxID=1335061 RepID=A0A7W9YZF9_9HYPH|nr:MULTISPECIES: hypothetical protein [Pseudorhizobium]MBB6180764.1 hypothetical protein [Pseudorhizobium flavum]
MSRLRLIHRLLAMGVAAAVPAVVFVANGTIAAEHWVLGAVIGLAYWYWGPTGASL